MNVRAIPDPALFKPGLRRSLSLLLLIAAGFCLPLRGQTTSVPSDQQAALFSRILAYDRNLKTRAGTQVTIGIVFRADNNASRAAAEGMFASFTPLKQRTIQGLPFDVVQQPYTDATRLSQWISDRAINVIYAAPGLDAAFTDIRSISTRQKIVVLTPDRKQVQQGFPLGVVIKDGKPGIVVNLTSAKELGMDLDPKLLQLSEVVH